MDNYLLGSIIGWSIGISIILLWIYRKEIMVSDVTTLILINLFPCGFGLLLAGIIYSFFGQISEYNMFGLILIVAVLYLITGTITYYGFKNLEER